MALYKNLEELIEGQDTSWKNSVNQMKNKDGQTIVKEIPETKFKDVKPDKIVQYGQVIGSRCVHSKLKYSQLRRFVDEIKSIEMSDDKINKLKLFRIPLLHGYSRQPETLKPFYEFVDALIKSDKIKDDDDFANFVRVIDSITAHYEALRDDNNQE